MAHRAKRYINSTVDREGPGWNHEQMFYLYKYSSLQLHFAVWRIFSLVDDKDNFRWQLKLSQCILTIDLI